MRGARPPGAPGLLGSARADEPVRHDQAGMLAVRLQPEGRRTNEQVRDR
jgi:hypothetical protein